MLENVPGQAIGKTDCSLHIPSREHPVHQCDNTRLVRFGSLGTLLGRRPLTGGCGAPDSTDRGGIGCALCGGREQLDGDRS